MAHELKRRLRQSKPFESREAEAYLYLVYVASALSSRVGRALKPAALSLAQYNALRILRGAGKTGLACHEVGSRMVHRVPDITRLLDRLERRGLVVRRRETSDRRVVRVWITPAGLALLTPLDAALLEVHQRGLGGLDREALETLIRTLDDVLVQLAE